MPRGRISFRRTAELTIFNGPPNNLRDAIDGAKTGTNRYSANVEHRIAESRRMRRQESLEDYRLPQWEGPINQLLSGEKGIKKMDEITEKETPIKEEFFLPQTAEEIHHRKIRIK